MDNEPVQQLILWDIYSFFWLSIWFVSIFLTSLVCSIYIVSKIISTRQNTTGTSFIYSLRATKGSVLSIVKEKVGPEDRGRVKVSLS